MGKKKEYKEANRRFLKKLSFQKVFLRCRVEFITKFWKLVKVRFLRVRGVLLPCITKEV